MQEGGGLLIIDVEYDSTQIQGIHLSVPRLGISEHLPQHAKLGTFPAGTYDAVLTAFSISGTESKHPIKVQILSHQEKVNHFSLFTDSHEILIVPVDNYGHTILFSEMKIENIDVNFRTVRDSKGVAYHLLPGEYRVKVFLPNLRMKTLTLKVSGGSAIYKICVEEREESPVSKAAPSPEKPAREPARVAGGSSWMRPRSEYKAEQPTPKRAETPKGEPRIEPRFHLTFPVAYRLEDGKWVQTTSLNVSTAGVCVINKKHKLNEGNVYVRLYLPVSSVPLECPARVVWSKEENVYPPQMGLQLYLTANMKSSLSNWLSNTG